MIAKVYGFLIGCLAQELSPKWPVLYASPNATSSLVLDERSGELYHAQGALEKFYCVHDRASTLNQLQECSASLVWISSNPLFHVTISVVDSNGKFASFNAPPTILAPPTQAKLDLTSIQESFPRDNGLYPATLEFIVELLVSDRPVQVTATVGGQQRSLRLMHDSQPPRVRPARQNVTATPTGDFTVQMTFRDGVYRSTGTGCDPRLHEWLPRDLDVNGNGWSIAGTPFPSTPISNTISAASVCSRAISDDPQLRPEHFVSLFPNIDPASLHGELDASRKTLFIHGKLMAREKRDRKTGAVISATDGEEVEIRVLGSTLMDAAGNQLLDNVTTSATVFRQRTHWQTDEVGYASSTTLMAASAVVAASSLAPSSSYGVTLGTTPGIGSVAEILTLGQKLYFIGTMPSSTIPRSLDAP